MDTVTPSRLTSNEAKPQFSKHLLEEFTRRVVEWTREHHPERLNPPIGEEDR